MPSRSILSRNGPFRSKFREIRRELRYRRLTKKAGRCRERSQAKFIAITGSSAKSTTTELVHHVLSGHARTQSVSRKNTRFPIVKGVINVRPKTKFAVFELGAGGTNSVESMAGDIQPDVAIVTMVGLEHVGHFRSREAIAEEKGYLVAALRPGGFALLNADDPNVMAMRERTGERIVTFGRERPADYRTISAEQHFPGPLTVVIEHAGGRETVTSQLAGTQFWLSITIAFAVATELGVPAAIIKERIASFAPLQRRCERYAVEGGPVFVLDTNKAPWETLPLAFDIVATADAPRRRIVLGGISDYKGSSNPKYRDAYKMARAIADEVIYVGDKSHRSQASAEDVESGRFHDLPSVEAVFEHIRDTAVPGEVILVKSASFLHLERVAIALDHDVKCWKDACGKKASCRNCGLYSRPFEEHKGREPRRPVKKALAAVAKKMKSLQDG